MDSLDPLDNVCNDNSGGCASDDDRRTYGLHGGELPHELSDKRVMSTAKDSEDHGECGVEAEEEANKCEALDFDACICVAKPTQFKRQNETLLRKCHSSQNWAAARIVRCIRRLTDDNAKLLRQVRSFAHMLDSGQTEATVFPHATGTSRPRADHWEVEAESWKAKACVLETQVHGLKEEIVHLETDMMQLDTAARSSQEGERMATIEVQKLQAEMQSLQTTSKDLVMCKAQAHASAAATDAVRKQLSSATAVCNVLIEAVSKGQKNGAYTLEEAATVYGAIKRLQSELAGAGDAK